jgi:hypothetical protein
MTRSAIDVCAEAALRKGRRRVGVRHLAVIVRRGLGGDLITLPTGLRALVNVVPLIVVPVVAGVVALCRPPAGGYVLLVSAFFWAALTARPARLIPPLKLPKIRRIVFSDGRIAAAVQVSAVGRQPCSCTNS